MAQFKWNNEIYLLNERIEIVDKFIDGLVTKYVWTSYGVNSRYYQRFKTSLAFQRYGINI